MRILAICNTTLQVICAIAMRNGIYGNCDFDIVVSDHIKNSDRIVENINKSGIFNKAIAAKSYEFCYSERQLTKKEKIIDCIFGREIMNRQYKKLLNLKDSYDVLLFNNIDLFVNVVYNTLKRRNKNLKVYLIEDGFSSYHAQGEIWKYKVNKCKGKAYRIKKKFLGIDNVANCIDGQYVYSPEDVRWEAPFERLKIPKIKPDDKAMIEKLNMVFGYENMEDVYDKPIIFFEESFRVSGMKIGDVELLEIVGDAVGRENIMVKKHPRSDSEFFEELGYKVNKNTEIPWEVIVLNNPDMVNKVFLTVCSGAAATPYTMFNMSVKSIVLLDMVQEYTKKLDNVYQVYFECMNKEVFEKYPDIFVKPKSKGELIKILKDEMRNL